MANCLRTKVYKLISEVLKCNLSLDPLEALLDKPPVGPPMSTGNSQPSDTQEVTSRMNGIINEIVSLGYGYTNT